MLNTILPRLRAAAMTATLAVAAAFVAPLVSAQGAGYWHTSGNKILDSNGTEVRIAGINWYGAETPDYIVHGLWAQSYQSVLNTIKNLGFNVIRIPFSNQLVESNPVPTNFTQFANGGPVNTNLAGQTALQDLDTIISYAGSIGLRVILDNHRSEAGETNEANGLWYTSAYPQANWIADWQTMATRYSASQFTFNGNPTVIGMDLRNEPHLSGSGATTGSCWTGDTATNGCPTSLTTQNWPVAATAAGNAILAVNPHLLIVVEGNDCYSGVCGWQGGNLIGVATNPVTLSVPNQLVYSAHDYGPNLFQQPWFNSNTTSASLDAIWNKYWGYISANGTAPVWLGEFGTDNSSSDIESNTAGSQGQWFSSLVAFLQNNPLISWTNWALNGEDTYALLDNNYDPTPVSSVKLSLLQSIQFPLGGGTVTPGFTLSPASSPVSVAPGGTATDAITVTDTGGFTGTPTLTASSSNSGVTPTVSGDTITVAASAAATGSATITVTGTSGSGSTAITANTSFTVNVTATLKSQTVTFATIPAQTVGTPLTLSATASSGLTVSFASTTSTVCTVSGTTATFLAAGTCSITASQAGNSTFAAATPVTQSFTVNPGTGNYCHIIYTISSQWPTGFGVGLTLENTGTTNWASWTLTWAFANGQTVTQLWNGSETQSGASVTVSNLSYNGSIPAGGSYNAMGFNGSWNGTTNSAPTAFTINGHACN